MSGVHDIFLSYSREDQAVARRYAEGFGRAGFSVWWDQALHPGEAFDQVTEKALEEAKAVVVLWSKTSVNSRWVRAEATQANANGRLVPVMIEPCKRPILFELTHTADLSAWKGHPDDSAWQAFVASLRRLVNEGTTSATGHVPTAAAARRMRRSWLPLATAAAMAVLLAAGGWWWLRSRDAPAAVSAALTSPTAATGGPAVQLTSVAVMPFANRTGDPDKDYFAEGVTEELINALTRVQGLKVASRTSSFAYRNREIDVRQVARELDVATIIEGSVRSAGDTVRLTAQMTNAETGYQIWSETYERDFRDLFQLQDDITREILTAYRHTMGMELPVFESDPPTQNLEAWLLFMRAMHAIELGTPEGMRQAVEHSRQAVALDPAFARAHWALAMSISLVPGGSLDEAERHALRANELDPPQGTSILIGINARHRKWIEAEELFRSLPQDSGSTTAIVSHAGGVLGATGKTRQAREEAMRARTLGPGVATYANALALMYAQQSEVSEAERFAGIALSLGADPAGPVFHEVNYGSALQAGRFEEAAGIAIVRLPPRLRTPEGEAAVRQIHAAFADPSQRESGVMAVKSLLADPAAYDRTLEILALRWYVRLGALDEAYALAEEIRKGSGEAGPGPTWNWLWAADMGPLRRDARFQPFVTRLGMMPYWERYGPPDACTLEGGKLSCR